MAAEAGMSHIFRVGILTDTQTVLVDGQTLGDLRKAVQAQFHILPFEQRLNYFCGGTPVVLEGDDSVLMSEKKGLLETKELSLARQVDPRYKMEKETGFLEALHKTNFKEATEILRSTGFAIDPNCVRKGRPLCNKAVSESPCHYSHPALTIAMMAGLENVVGCLRCNPQAIQTWMDRENEVCEVVKLLIEMEADVNSVGDEQQDCESAGVVTVHEKTPLCAAVQRGSPVLVRMLLDAKADANHTMKYDQSAWGPDRQNPLGPGVLKPESWLGEICNGSVGKRDSKDPRNRYRDEIFAMLRAA